MQASGLIRWATVDRLNRNAPHPLTALLPGARQTIDDILRATAQSFDAAAWYTLAADPAARSRAAVAAGVPAGEWVAQLGREAEDTRLHRWTFDSLADRRPVA